ncbi:hypothetical protein HELRODRAFT_163942 [Helobdella robusta]|uniref:Uncharacterized protein n=1 Tax=Helobdella robusta TaxID=6412 RepID=T1EUN0_HELRO|nr:hypothetical protein HELRODRAFT_163942 [Helobdella robusta]ESN94158.1 hypothetical protein HELRODRAFT_163942 [Helobdella robusta]
MNRFAKRVLVVLALFVLFIYCIIYFKKDRHLVNNHDVKSAKPSAIKVTDQMEINKNSLSYCYYTSVSVSKLDEKYPAPTLVPQKNPTQAKIFDSTSGVMDMTYDLTLNGNLDCITL